MILERGYNIGINSSKPRRGRRRNKMEKLNFYKIGRGSKIGAKYILAADRTDAEQVASQVATDRGGHYTCVVGPVVPTTEDYENEARYYAAHRCSSGVGYTRSQLREVPAEGLFLAVSVGSPCPVGYLEVERYSVSLAQVTRVAQALYGEQARITNSYTIRPLGQAINFAALKAAVK